MIILHLILAATAVGLLALRPRSSFAAAMIAALAAVDVALGASTHSVAGLLAPLVGFLSAALSLARLIERSGLAARVAAQLARTARGNTVALYALVCVVCLGLTVTVSLDGAVVLMIPVLRSLVDRFRAPMSPLFLGVVAVANVGSIAVPQGNPTNLVLISRLGLSPLRFTLEMLVPGLLAAALAALAVGAGERRALAAGYSPATEPPGPLSSTELHAAFSLLGAAAAAWLAPLLGVAPWWPFTGAVVVALALRGRRPELIVPWRIAVQIAAVLIVVTAVGLQPPSVPTGLLGLLGAALALAAVAALLNNLPASVWAAALLTGRTGYAATIGLAIGPLATPHGSVATLIASDLAGAVAPPIPKLRFALISGAAMLAATLLLWIGA